MFLGQPLSCFSLVLNVEMPCDGVILTSDDMAKPTPSSPHQNGVYALFFCSDCRLPGLCKRNDLVENA